MTEHLGLHLGVTKADVVAAARETRTATIGAACRRAGTVAAA